MAYNYQPAPFWDFVNSLDGQTHGAGVDHADYNPFGHGPHGPAGFGGHFPGGPGFMFGPPRGAFGPRGGRGGRCGRGRHGGHHEGPHRSPSPPDEHREGEASGPEGPDGPSHRDLPFHHRGRYQRGSRHCGRSSEQPPFDLSSLINAFASHPIAQSLRTYAEQNGFGASGETLVPDNDSVNNFTPPIDIFSTPTAYVLHVALPGAQKEDVGVNWDAEKSELNVAGVVYRRGDEEFLKTLSKSERKVGVFERSLKLPPGEEEKEEVDGDNISAKLEDGVLVVTVPKVEKEWTEVKKVDIE